MSVKTLIVLLLQPCYWHGSQKNNHNKDYILIRQRIVNNIEILYEM